MRKKMSKDDKDGKGRGTLPPPEVSQGPMVQGNGTTAQTIKYLLNERP